MLLQDTDFLPLFSLAVEVDIDYFIPDFIVEIQGKKADKHDTIKRWWFYKSCGGKNELFYP